MEKAKNKHSMRYVAEEIAKRLESQLPVMRRDLRMLRAISKGLMPLTIHNISLCVEERVYMFIEPTLRLYKSALPKQKKKFGIFKVERTDDEKKIEERITFLEDLLRREHTLYNTQLDEAKEDIKREKKALKEEQEAAAKDGRTLAERPIATLQERIEYFRHVEIDMYEFVFPLVALEGRGIIHPDEQFYEEIDNIRKIAIAIYEEFIPKREQALANAKEILASSTD